jgi:hypothetical protein
MGNYTSLQNERESVKRTIKPKGLVNEPLLQSLVTIERLVLEAIRFLDNCPLRGEPWVQDQIKSFETELGWIQGQIKTEVFMDK